MQEVKEFDYEALPDTSFVVHMAAGALAGMTEHVVTFPFDTMKTRMQEVNGSFRGLYRGLLAVHTNEGLGSLWRGVNSCILGSGNYSQSW